MVRGTRRLGSSDLQSSGRRLRSSIFNPGMLPSNIKETSKESRRRDVSISYIHVCVPPLLLQNSGRMGSRELVKGQGHGLSERGEIILFYKAEPKTDEVYDQTTLLPEADVSAL